MLTFEELQAKKKPKTVTVSILLDANLREPVHAAESKVSDLKSQLARQERQKEPSKPVVTRLKKELKAAETELDKATKAIDEATEHFEFRALGGNTFHELMKRHRPTPKELEDFQADQKKKGEPGTATMGLSPSTFPPAICCAATTSHRHWSKEDWIQLFDSDEWNDAERNSLWHAAYHVQTAL